MRYCMRLMMAVQKPCSLLRFDVTTGIQFLALGEIFQLFNARRLTTLASLNCRVSHVIQGHQMSKITLSNTSATEANSKNYAISGNNFCTFPYAFAAKLRDAWN
jgi:hypothetical protein